LTSLSGTNDFIKCTACLLYWRKAYPQRAKGTKTAKSCDEANVVTIASVKTKQHHVYLSETTSVSVRTTKHRQGWIFTDKDGWKAAESMRHLTLQLLLTTDQDDYNHIGSTCPNITPTHVSVVTDTGAQSCL